MSEEQPARRSFGKLGRAIALALAPGLAAVSVGCGFFPKLNKCTSNCTTSTDFVYVANGSNTTASPPSIAGFSLTTTTTAATTTTPATSTLSLAATPGSAYALGYVPTAIAITPNNKFMYVASLAGIYLYAINGDGSITLQNNKQVVAANLNAPSMKVDSSGTWLLVAGFSTATTASTISVYPIAAATGFLSAAASTTVLNDIGKSVELVIAPNKTNVFIALQAGGLESLVFNSANGTFSATQQHLKPLAATNGDNGVATDPSSTYAFVAEAGVGAGVRVLKVGTDGSLTEVANSPFTTGVGPTGVLVDSTGAYVYVTNQTSNTISEFTLDASTGALTSVEAPIATGTAPVDIVEDSSGKYVAVVCNGGGKDLEVYSFDATTAGKLDAAANETTGTDPTLAFAIAATH